MRGITQVPERAAVVNVKRILSPQREQELVRHVPRKEVDITQRPGLAIVQSVPRVNTGTEVVVPLVPKVSSQQKGLQVVHSVQRRANTGTAVAVRNVLLGITVLVTDMLVAVDRVAILRRERVAVANVVLIPILREPLTAVVQAVLRLVIISQQQALMSVHNVTARASTGRVQRVVLVRTVRMPMVRIQVV